MKIEICEKSGRVYTVSMENGAIKKVDVTSQAIESIKQGVGKEEKQAPMWL